VRASTPWPTSSPTILPLPNVKTWMVHAFLLQFSYQ
jgi:hypothetical protein